MSTTTTRASARVAHSGRGPGPHDPLRAVARRRPARQRDAGGHGRRQGPSAFRRAPGGVPGPEARADAQPARPPTRPTPRRTGRSAIASASCRRSAAGRTRSPPCASSLPRPAPGTSTSCACARYRTPGRACHTYALLDLARELDPTVRELPEPTPRTPKPPGVRPRLRLCGAKPLGSQGMAVRPRSECPRQASQGHHSRSFWNV